VAVAHLREIELALTDFLVAAGRTDILLPVKLNLHTSILQLTLIGFLLTVLPLIAALLHTIVRMDALSQQIRSSIVNIDQAVQSSRILLSNVLALERSAAQYVVLRDDSVLNRYKEQRATFNDVVSTLLSLNLSSNILDRLLSLQAREREVFAVLRKETPADEVDSENPVQLPIFAELARPLPIEISHTVARRVKDIEQQAFHVQRLLFIQAMALIPLALVVAIAFTVVITKPLREIGQAIRRLGSGDFSLPIHVSGPQDIQKISEYMEWLRSRLNDLDRQKMQFLQHVSHELKTPLTVIREGSELLNEGIVGQLTVEQAEVSEIICSNSQQLQKQIEDLLKFNRALARMPSASGVPIRLSHTVTEAIESFRLPLLSRRLAIETGLSDVVITGDVEEIRTVIDNLISNAINYSPDEGIISVYLGSDEEYAILEVKDQGPGIDGSERRRVFEAFYQGKTVRKGHVKGTGLGLALSQRIAALHRGKIEILDSPQGAYFQLKIPLQPINE
jgi:two-component system sensor histidine kinase GlrK